MVQKSFNFLCVVLLTFAILGSGAGIAAASDYDITLTEGEVAEIQDGYYLSVMDVDTYSETTRFIVSYYDTSVLDQYYAIGDYLYYEDRNIIVEFRVDDVYYDSFYGYDYVVISDLYIYPDYTVIYDDTYTTRTDTDYYSDYDSSDYDYSDTSSDDEIFGMLILLFLVFVVVLVLRKILRRGKSRKEKKEQKALRKQEIKQRAAMSSTPISEKKSAASENATEAAVTSTGAGVAATTATAATSGKDAVVVKSAVQYKGANILYKIKVENHSEEPMGDINISLFVPDVFHLKDDKKNISMLQPGESKTATFMIRPTGECGNCIISGNIRYYDYSQKKHVQMDLSDKMVDIVCPVLRVMQMDESGWRSSISSMMVAEEDTKDLEVPAENLFDIATRILKDMNMFMIDPEITSTQQLFTGVARFYAEGVAGMKYAAYIEVVGKRKSRLIVKAWAEKEEALTGFYHKIIEEIEKRTDVKLFVDDSVTHYNISNTTTIQDSVIQRSNIGGGKKKCPQCGREAEGSEKFCMNCGQRLD
ncbi:zinc-ribbon domain-containing protein [Methanolobus sp. WCC4]|uniref:zinc-ribbon domain-containing protein n=1 Tax=Methanolobus sp. WCC4 TaxID=3125784 RepID=UPI0030F4E80C